MSEGIGLQFFLLREMFMFRRKYLLLFVSIAVMSRLFAQVDSEALSLVDETKAKNGKISSVENKLKQFASKAALSGDSKLKACIQKYLVTVNGLVTSADSITSQIVLLATTGKTMEARNQMGALNTLTDSADQALAQAKSCERSDAVSQNQDENGFQKSQRASVSEVMELNVGNNFPTEIDRSAIKGSDSVDAASAETSDVQHSSN